MRGSSLEQLDAFIDIAAVLESPAARRSPD
jgi:hypothetical protein